MPRNLVENWCIIDRQNESVTQTILRIKFCWKKYTVNASFVNNMKKLLTT